MFVKEHANTDEEKIELMKSTPSWSPDPNELPSVVPPKGLSGERQWYLYEVSARFVPTMARIPLALFPKFPSQVVHQAYLFITHGPMLTILNLQ